MFCVNFPLENVTVHKISSLSCLLLFIAILCSTDSFASEPAPNHLVTITLERTACYGRCPIYSVEINRDGRVYFFGKKYVAVKGKKIARIMDSDFASLEAKFKKIDFLSLRNTYAGNEDGCKEVWTDNPSIVITAKYNRVHKKVGYYMGCRGLPILVEIEHLADAIDDTVGTSKWIDKW